MIDLLALATLGGDVAGSGHRVDNNVVVVVVVVVEQTTAILLSNKKDERLVNHGWIA